MKTGSAFILLSVLCLSAMLVLLPGRADAQESGDKLALVIGNSDYASVGTLPNAKRDAQAFHAFLLAQNFQSTLLVDTDRKSLAEAVARFVRRIGPQDTALFYFAGHGMQLRGENFLLGTEAELASEFDVPGETLALSEVISAMERRAKVSLLFIDACRDNPLANRLNAEVEGASRGAATRGLAPIKSSGSGTMVAFAAAPGQVALDGIGNHSPFTKALIGNLAAPGLEVGTAFKRVIRQVRSETKDRQSPQLLSSLVLEFYFGPEKAAIPEAKAPEVIDPAAIEAEADFRKALRINTARTWKQFVAKHRSSEQAVLARQFLQQMQPAGSTITPTAQEKESRFVTSPQQRKEIQIALAAKGITSGTADGAFGSQTRQAIKAFQRSVGLPGTGFVNEETAGRLGVSLNWREDGIYSSTNARRYNSEDFFGLETDPLVLRALACAPRSPKVFGSYSGHLYIVVQHIMVVQMVADEMAKKCGGYLAVITSKAENEFVAALMNGDQGFFNMGYDVSENTGYKMGSWIGLVQDQDGREPRGGWRWQNGQPLAYSNWNAGKPNEHKKGDDFVMFYDDRRGQKDMKPIRVVTWDDMGPGNTTNSYVVELE